MVKFLEEQKGYEHFAVRPLRDYRPIKYNKFGLPKFDASTFDELEFPFLQDPRTIRRPDLINHLAKVFPSIRRDPDEKREEEEEKSVLPVEL